MAKGEPRSLPILVLGATFLVIGLMALPAPEPRPPPYETPTTTLQPLPPVVPEAFVSRSPHSGLAVPTELEDPSGHALDRFHEALRRTERGEDDTRILFFGASHTAADHLPGHLREELQERFGDGGRGFTLPAPPSTAYAYWQWGATIDDGEGWTRVRLGPERGEPDYYGIAGIYYDSEGREAIARVSTAESGVGSSADVIEVLYQRFEGGGELVVVIDGEERGRLDSDAPRVEAGRAVYEVEEGAHVVELRALAGAPVRIYGIVLERSAPGVVVDDVALTGSRARYHEKWLEPIYGEHLRMRDPDLLVLWYGGNEGNDLPYPADRTSAEIRRALDKLLAAAPTASCVLLGAADKPLERDGEWVHRERTDAINRAMRTLAFAHGCAFFDTVAFMGGPLSMVRWVEADPTLARDDYIHFSALGYELLADNLLFELLLDTGAIGG